MNKIGTFLIFALCFASAAAQDELLELDLEEEVRRYTVEIIIFSYEENVAVGTEIFLPDKPRSVKGLLDGADEAGFDPDEGYDEDEVASEEDDAKSRIREIEFTLLTEDELTLDKAARQFALLDVYETIMHFGWTQPTFPQEETPPIELRVLGKPPKGLEGSFTLYLGRYLHLVVDLALDAPDTFDESATVDAPIYSDDSVYSYGDSRRHRDDGFDTRARPVRYRIQEDRIVKNGELRYFDHPKFGVLAKITRVEEEENAEEDELYDPLLSSIR